MDAPELVIVGRLRRAHGVRGEIVVDPITDAPAEVFSAGRRVFLGTADGDPAPDARTLTVSAARPFQDELLVRFAELASRDDAERLRHRYLLLPSGELPPPDEDEIYLHDLLGMHVATVEGEDIGDVLAYYELPAGITLEVAWRNGAVLLPFREEFVEEVDRDARRITMRLPEGMLD